MNNMTIGAKDAVDPFTLEIIKSKLDRAADEGCLALEMAAGSIVVAEAHDYIVALYTPDGYLLAGGAGFVSVLPAVGLAIRHVIATYGEDPGIQEGDIYYVNDPYVGAMHAPDALMIQPCYFQGELVGFVSSFVHLTDSGGLQPGGWHTEATERYQEGFQTAGLKIAEKGRLRRDVWDSLVNQVRFPERVILDLRSTFAACNVARASYLRIFESYGRDTTLTACRELLDRSARLLRERLSELPDGRWSARLYFDYHGTKGEAVFPIQLTLTKHGERMSFDFAGTHDQVQMSINSAFPLTYGCTIGPLYSMLTWDMPINEGINRCIEVTAPEGCMVNPKRPAAVSCSTESMAHIIQNLSAMVASKMLSTSRKYAHRATAAWGAHAGAQLFGVDSKFNFVTEATSDLFACSAGAQSFKDGADVGGEMAALTTRVPNTETSELYFPGLFLYKRIVPDSGGPGKFRGGTIVEWAIKPHGTPAHNFGANMFSGRGVTFPQAQGLFGGLPGCTTDYVQFRNSNSAEFPGNRTETTGQETYTRMGFSQIEANDIMYLRTGGGGGFGDPLERDPAAVLRDVVASYVSPESARSVYGVALDPDGKGVDEAATSALRTTMRRNRIGNGSPLADTGAAVALTDRPLGGYLQIAGNGADAQVQCTNCGTKLCPASADWKDHVVRNIVVLAVAGPVHRDNGEAVLRQHVCPSCATLLDAELARPNDAILHDRVTAWPASRSA
jgi:N-methylhydantoinase B